MGWRAFGYRTLWFAIVVGLGLALMLGLSGYSPVGQ